MVSDRDALQRNIALAERLGATVVRVTADRPADGLIAFAKREGITHVIFGQSARSRWEILMKGSTLNRFLDEVRDAAISRSCPRRTGFLGPYLLWTFYAFLTATGFTVTA